ncbi:MAG: hypothetical protein ACK5QB_17130 [Pseudanabaena sp.]
MDVTFKIRKRQNQHRQYGELLIYRNPQSWGDASTADPRLWQAEAG